MKPLLRLACLFVALLIAVPSEVWARGSSSRGSSFSGGSSRSSSSSSSRSSSSGSSSKSSWGSSSGSSTRTATSSGGSSWGSSSRFSSNSSAARNTSDPSSSASTQRSGPTSSATDAALGRKVGQGGNTFKSRSEAVNDFTTKHANEYKSTFSKEPSSRPSYIPPTTSVGGNTYNVYYNSGYGGYGYMMGGNWVAYNAMSDAIMLNSLMNNRGYSYYDGSGPSYGYGRSYHSSSGGGVFVGLLFIIILIVVAVVVVKYLSSKSAVAKDPYRGAAAKMGAPPPLPPERNLQTSPMDKSKAADWLAVKPNSVVTISDTQGIADSMKRGLGVRGIDYTVRSIGVLKQLNGLSTHILFTLHDEAQVTYLLVKIVDDLIDLGLYFEVDGLAPGTRQDLVDRGALWLFQEPANPQNFDPAELRYTTTIRQTLPTASGAQEEVLFEIKAQGELQCDYTEKPPRTGMGPNALATIVEYKTAQEVENPEFLIVEIGEKNGASSYVQFFLGCGVKFSEVDVLPA